MNGLEVFILCLSLCVILCWGSVVLLSIPLLMVKLLLKYMMGNQGLLPMPMPAPVKVNVVVSGKKEKETDGGTIPHLFTHMFTRKKG